MANIREIAKKAGVGVATVSRYINNSGYVSAESERKIRKAVEELNYVPNALARAIFTKDTKIVGILIPNIQNPFFNQMVTEMEKIFIAEGYTMVLCNTDDDPVKEKQSVETLRGYRVAGIVAMRSMSPESYHNLNIPIVAFENIISPDVVTVASDNLTGGRIAFEHLYEKGCRKILHIQGAKGFTATNDRLKGFLAAAAEKNDVVVDVVGLNSGFKLDIIASKLEQIANLKDYDGVFVFNDISAAAVMKRIYDLNLSVPDDIQVVAFDNSFISELIRPTLTSIGQPVVELSRLTANLLIRQIKGEVIEQKEFYLETRLVKRNTTK